MSAPLQLPPNLPGMDPETIRVINDRLRRLSTLTGTPAPTVPATLQATHAMRIAKFPPGDYPEGSTLLETDRGVAYVQRGGHWYYQSGVMQGLLADRPADLARYDAGLPFYASDDQHRYHWDGSAWIQETMAPGGTAGGDLAGTYPSPTLKATGTAGTYTKVTTDAAGRVSSGTTLTIADLPVTTMVGSPGVDTQVPTEKAVRTAIGTAIGSVTSSQWTTSGSTINYSGGNVGVGVVPGVIFDIVDSAAGGMRIRRATDGTAGDTRLLSDTGLGIVGTFSNHNFSVWVNGGEKVTFLPGGTVGINKTVPAISDGIGLHIGGKIIRLDTAKTPATAGAAGNVGEICWDAAYIYVCVAANTWRRIAHATW